MGNLHDVIQTDPWRSPRGAAIEIVPGLVSVFADVTFPSYVSIGTGHRAIGKSQLATERSFLVIQPGGKWGYDHAFAEFFREHAHLLEDACFYIGDEYAMYLEEYRITNGVFELSYLASQNEHVGLYLAEHRPEHLDFALELLSDYLRGAWFSEAEDDSMRGRAVKLLVEHAGPRWETWFQYALFRTDANDHTGSVPLFERALELAPADEHAQIEVRLLRALAELGTERALEFGRPRLARWVEASAKADRYFNEISPGVEMMAELERTRGEVTVATTSWMDAIRTSNTNLAPRLYAIARLRATEHRHAEACDWLRAATLLDPTLATDAVDCGDFAKLPGPDLVRVLELARDLDEPSG
jgi:tetratricopeptide (TPR) repeat protein